MYLFQNSYFYSKNIRPAINKILDINKQKYNKNRVIIKRRFSYSNPGGPPNDPEPYMMLLLLPLVIGIHNIIHKYRR